MADPTRIKARIAFLKRTRPNDPEIKTLTRTLAKLTSGDPKTADESGGVGKPEPEEKPGKDGKGDKGGDAPPTEPPPPTPDEIAAQVADIANRAGTFGDTLADKYIPKGTFGTLDEGVSPEMQAYLDRLNAFAQQSGNFTNYEQQVLDMQQQGLGGYLAPEQQAMREQRLQEVDAELANQQRMQAMAQARGGVRGAYAGAQQANLGRAAVQTRGNIEQDLFIKNADEVQRRKTAFADLVNKTEAARFGRKTGAEALYGGNLAGEESVQRGVKQFNIGQKSNEATARGGLALGGAGTYTGLYGNVDASNLAKSYFDLATSQGEANAKILRDTLAQRRREFAASNSNANNN